MIEQTLPPELAKRLTTYAQIDLDAVAANVQALRAHTGPSVALIAVIKANAYGHGAAQIARAVLENGASRLAVGRTDEGIQLRQEGITAPILNLCYSVPDEADLYVRHDLIAAITTVEVAQALSHRAEALGKKAVVHVKVDTGMGRYGLLPDQVIPFLRQTTPLPGLEIEGIFTHFSVADERDKTYTYEQLKKFNDVLAIVKEAGYDFKLRHAANSAATLDLPETHFDAVRPGLALFGLYPSTEVSHDVPLRQALTLKSHAARVEVLSEGSSISYGRTFTTTKPTRIVLVPIGYGDGYFRLLSNRASVLINGQRARVAGRVCMDQLMVDASGVDTVAQDDEVVLIGKQGTEEITVEELAELADTINYEVLTNLARRLTRVYVQGGEVVEISHLANGD
jgi:alanine racemase